MQEISVKGISKIFNILLWLLDILWKCLWSVFMNRKKKQWSASWLVVDVLIDSLEHTIYFFIVRLFLAMITCQEVVAWQHLICHTSLPLHHFTLQVQTSCELHLSLLWTSCVNFFHKCVIDISLKGQWKFIERKNTEK